MMELLDRQHYTTEKGKNGFGTSSLLPDLVVNDMLSNLRVFMSWLYHSEDLQTKQENPD